MIPQSRGAMQGARGRPAAAPENRERRTENGTPLRGDGRGRPTKPPNFPYSGRPACGSTPLICNQSVNYRRSFERSEETSAVPRLGSPTGANQASKPPNFQASGVGAPGGVRTPDPRLRRPLLYPTELQARKVCGQRSAREAQSIHSSSSSWGKARSQKPREMRKSGSCFQPSSET